jgi:hypothetical protein
MEQNSGRVENDHHQVGITIARLPQTQIAKEVTKEQVARGGGVHQDRRAWPERSARRIGHSQPLPAGTAVAAIGLSFRPSSLLSAVGE